MLTVAFNRGFGHVTLDAVANEARISKGRILYHFATKLKMIESLVTACASCSDPLVRIRDESGGAEVEVNALALAALVAGAEDPELLRPISKLLLPSAAFSAAPDPAMLLGSLLGRLQLLHNPEQPWGCCDEGNAPQLAPADGSDPV